MSLSWIAKELDIPKSKVNYHIAKLLEEELRMQHSPHDDIIDALTAAIDVAIAPSRHNNRSNSRNNIISHPRFGGIRRRA